MRTLGKTKIIINEIGCGGIPIQRVSQKDVDKMINTMINDGVNFIDSARGYTNSEELFGRALVGKREKFILATKSMARTYESMKQDIEISLRNFQTDYIDLYQLHNVGVNENYSGALRALEEAKNQGIIKHIGITTHSLEMLEKVINENYFETIQFPYNIVETQAEELFKKAKEKNIGVIVMKPLAGGAIIDAHTALGFILQNPNVSVIIPGMESCEQIKENVSVLKNKVIDNNKVINIKEELNYDFCRRCGYCMPCTVGINIPFSFLCEGYYSRYNLKEWAKSRYNSMTVKPSQCIECRKCEQRCPYKLKIVKKLKNVTKIMEE